MKTFSITPLCEVEQANKWFLVGLQLNTWKICMRMDSLIDRVQDNSSWRVWFAGCVSHACWTLDVGSVTVRTSQRSSPPPVCQSIRPPRSTQHGAGESQDAEDGVCACVKNVCIIYIFNVLVECEILTVSSSSRCTNSSLMRDQTYWAYNYCPTSYSWLVLLGLMCYLAAFAPGNTSNL